MRTLLLTLVLLIPYTGLLRAQESFFTSLIKDPPQKIVLTSNWDSMVLMKNEDAHKSALRVVRESGTEDWEVEISVRGRFRRARCVFPPLELNLKKGALRDKGMFEFDKLKLVTQCNTENADPADIFEELLIYQLYCLLTPMSFKAIPLHVDYLNPNGKTYQKNADAVLLEPTGEVAHRLGGIELEIFGVTADSLDAASYCRNALFQFMVGNFDWDAGMQRNVKMIGHPGHYHCIPYDFDFAAIVYPMYARMPADFGLQDFRDRVYLGNYFDDQLPGVINEFITKKDALLSHVENFSALSKTRRREIVKYLEHFFAYIQSPDVQITRGTILPYQE